MNSEELQILLDINSSHDFQELRTKVAIRLSGMQRDMYQASTSHYDSLQALLESKKGRK